MLAVDMGALEIPQDHVDAGKFFPRRPIRADFWISSFVTAKFSGHMLRLGLLIGKSERPEG
jgi:hypothetical protein